MKKDWRASADSSTLAARRLSMSVKHSSFMKNRDLPICHSSLSILRFVMISRAVLAFASSSWYRANISFGVRRIGKPCFRIAMTSSRPRYRICLSVKVASYKPGCLTWFDLMHLMNDGAVDINFSYSSCRDVLNCPPSVGCRWHGICERASSDMKRREQVCITCRPFFGSGAGNSRRMSGSSDSDCEGNASA